MGESVPQQRSANDSSALAILTQLPIVETARVRSYDTSETLDVETNGVVVPFREVMLASEVAGRLTFKSEQCRAGNYVSKDDVLFRVDEQDYRLTVERLTAQKQSEYSQQRELEQEVSNTQRLVEVSRKDLEFQEREVKRLKDLPTGYATAAELDAAERSRLTSINALTSLENQLDLLRTRRTRIELAEKLADAELQQAKLNLSRCEIVSPISGIIVNEAVQNDSFVNRGTTLCTIEDTTKIEVSCNLRTDQLAMILNQIPSTPKSANKVEGTNSDANRQTLISQSYDLPPTPVTIVYRIAGRDDIQYTWDGELSRYEGVGVDVQSRTISVRVLVKEPRFVSAERVGKNRSTPVPADQWMVPTMLRGMFVQAIFRTKPNEPMLLIPKLAVRPGGEVWLFDQDSEALSNAVERAAQNEELSKKSDGKEMDASQPTKGIAESENADEQVDDVEVKEKIDMWRVGYVKVFKGIRVVRVVEQGEGEDRQEYWVAQVADQFDAGSAVITTPLAAILGDGTDMVRIEKE